MKDKIFLTKDEFVEKRRKYMREYYQKRKKQAIAKGLIKPKTKKIKPKNLFSVRRGIFYVSFS
tara:strand:- start:660 stop:848 length:189 start_codon:yes stop_codon:yes gene_type:complete